MWAEADGIRVLRGMRAEADGVRMLRGMRAEADGVRMLRGMRAEADGNPFLKNLAYCKCVTQKEFIYFVGVGDLLHNKVPSEFLRGKDRERAVFTAIRQNLKKANYHNFGTLLEAFRHYDKKGDGRIDKEELRKSCFQLNIDLDEELLDALFDYCDLDKDGLIDYLEFVNFLNWKDKMSVEEFEKNIITKGKKPDVSEPFLPEDAEIKTNDGSLLKDEDLVSKEPGTSEKTPKTLTRPTDRVFADYRTTSSQYNATVGGLPATCYPLCGVPTIRSDIPAPRIRRISDRTNYGDEANAYALLCPSVFSEKGVYERDFFKTRPKAEIAQILHNIGVSISDQNLEEVWKQACMKHHREEPVFLCKGKSFLCSSRIPCWCQQNGG
ncbi:EF-hand domain-containing family member B [Dermochelys coriacea]|uniref:EF-hand domain-containing family member B n=1 Tax=Dermochelys coriacea TaxID=27794 RepID=UPI001CA8160A|nr:EF-hand domain-containing family member B [Dermochelys coriacea]